MGLFIVSIFGLIVVAVVLLCGCDRVAGRSQQHVREIARNTRPEEGAQ